MDIKEIIKNLELIIDVTPDYIQGRKRGLTDDETEMLACKAVYEAIEVLEKLENEHKYPECCTTWHRAKHINIEWVVEKKEGEDEEMKIKIKYFNKDYPRIKKIEKGDWIDLRVDSIKEWRRNKGREFDFAEYMSVPCTFKNKGISYRKGDIIKFGLGVAMELPEGYEAEIRPRSSTFKKYGLIQTNSVGTIDNSYKGDNDEWMVEFIAMRDGTINRFDRVCQFRIWENQPSFEFEEVEHLGNEDRGGYGSTGRD